MPLIEWTQKLSVNFEEIDNQHKKLIQLINKLHDAMKKGKGSSILDDVLKEMTDYAKYHFGTEEKFMEQFKFPELKEHKEQHHDFINKVGEFTEEMKDSKIGMSLKVMHFLADWLKTHIINEDHKYVPYLKK